LKYISSLRRDNLVFGKLEVSELHGWFSHGKTYEEVVANVQKVIEEWIGQEYKIGTLLGDITLINVTNNRLENSLKAAKNLQNG